MSRLVFGPLERDFDTTSMIASAYTNYKSPKITPNLSVYQVLIKIIRWTFFLSFQIRFCHQCNEWEETHLDTYTSTCTPWGHTCICRIWL